MTDTIAAIATGLTRSGLGIVRISGPDSLKTITKIFRNNGASPLSWKPNRIHYGMIVSRETLIDEVLVMNMKAPHSYTGEDTVEIDCHGGPLVMRQILEAVLATGCARLAEPGEFTKRAFLNGRIDLAQAESVIDIINATNDNARQAAVGQLRGSVSEAIRALRDRILGISAFIEAALDDPEHYELDSEYREKLRTDLRDLIRKTEELLRTHKYGKLMKEGINTCILGRPNAGKSSLLNALLGENRAIVTDVPGTTRDIITESIAVDNLTLNIMDTAGLRETEDQVESIGVRMAYENAKKADLILYVIDRKMTPEDEKIVKFIEENGLNAIYLMNKSDLSPDPVPGALSISAKTGDGIPVLLKKIRDMFETGKVTMNDQVVITSERHASLLRAAKTSLESVLASEENGMPEDFLTIDLMDAYHSLGLIIGEETGDDLADRIFSDFCMGK